MLTHKDLIEEFISFEKEKKLFELRINNIPIWELIRMTVFTDLKNRVLNKNRDINKRNPKKSFNVFFQFLVNILFYNPFFISKQKKYLILNHPRRKLNSNIYEDIYTNSILPFLNNDFFVFEGYVNINIGHYSPVKSDNLYYLDIIQFTSHLFGFFPDRTKLSLSDINIISEIENAINSNWNTKILNLEKEISKKIKRFNYVKPRIEKLLNKTNPEKIINVVSYSFINQVFTYCARKRNIPVYELQHGTVGKYHIAYNFGKNPFDNIESFPNYFLAWGENWIKNTNMPILRNNIKVVGFPYFDNFRKENQQERNPKKILVISQYRTDILKFTLEMGKLLTDYEIIYKAHPAEYLTINNQYSFFKEVTNISIIADDKIHLYDLFKQSNFVLGVNSTALIEAVAFCPYIFILKFPGWEYFEDLEESNNLKFISNVEEAKINIQESLIDRMNNDVTNYFEFDSIKKIGNLIDFKT